MRSNKILSLLKAFFILVALGLFFGAAFYWDQNLARYFGQDFLLKPFFQWITHLGDGLFFLGLLGVLCFYFSYFKPKGSVQPLWMEARNLTSPKVLKVSRDLIFLYILSGIFIFCFKCSMGRRRPSGGGDYDPWIFEFFSLSPSHHSFPSGHTFTVFYFLIFLALFFGIVTNGEKGERRKKGERGKGWLVCKAWGRCIYRCSWLSLSLYFLAAFIGFSRVAIGKHFLSDVLGGALIGIFIAFFSFHFLRKKYDLKVCAS